jgi:hypothetical protein
MAAVAEEPRLLESVPGAEDAVEIDGAAGEEGRAQGDEDEEILRFMDSVDGYLLLMDSLSSALRQVPTLLASVAVYSIPRDTLNLIQQYTSTPREIKS